MANRIRLEHKKPFDINTVLEIIDSSFILYVVQDDDLGSTFEFDPTDPEGSGIFEQECTKLRIKSWDHVNYILKQLVDDSDVIVSTEPISFCQILSCKTK